MKKWYQSKTMWLAIIQGAIGIMVAYFAQNPEVTMSGWGLIVKSIIDVYLRNGTSTAIE